MPKMLRWDARLMVPSDRNMTLASPWTEPMVTAPRLNPTVSLVEVAVNVPSAAWTTELREVLEATFAPAWRPADACASDLSGALEALMA
jgi:hypothetical protein